MASQAISLTGILQFFGADENTIRKGELKFTSGFVLDLRICDFILSAKVRASMKDKSYSAGPWLQWGVGGVTPPQASSLSAKLLRIKVLSAIFRKSILSQEDDN